MILKRLKSNRATNLFLIPVAALVFGIKSLLHPFTYDFFQGEKENILFAPVYKWVGSQPLVQVIVAIVLVIVLAFLMQLINDRYTFIRIRSKLSPILFVIIVGGLTEVQTLHPVYFGAIFVLFAINRLFSIFEKSKPYSAIFDAGLLLGVGSLFYFNLIVLFPVFLLSVPILCREPKWRDFTILILGFLLPFGFAFSYAAFTDGFMELLDVFLKNVTTPISHFLTNVPLQIYLGVLIIVTVTGSVGMLGQYDQKKVSSRKYFTVFFWMFIFSLLSFTFIPATSQEMLVITAIPVTFLTTNLFVFMKSRFWSELLFLLLLGIVILLQFTEQLF
jgi:hypothetical protein